MEAPPTAKKAREGEGKADRTNQPLRGIFTTEEVTLLDLWLPRFLLLKRTHGKKFVGFWEPLFEAYFKAHPLPPLTPEEIASGIDQGNRKGGRMKLIKKVYQHILFIY